jgi:hypothetical protein
MKRFVPMGCGCEEMLLSKSTWDKKILNKLRRGGILHNERVAKVSNKTDSSFFALTFFRVKAVHASEGRFAAAQDFNLPLSEFIGMCDSLEKFVGGGVESPLSSQTRDRLQEYTGTLVKIPSTSLTRPSLAFSTFIEKL